MLYYFFIKHWCCVWLMMLALVLGIYLPTKICAEKFGNVIIYGSSISIIIPDALILLESHFEVLRCILFFSTEFMYGVGGGVCMSSPLGLGLLLLLGNVGACTCFEFHACSNSNKHLIDEFTSHFLCCIIFFSADICELALESLNRYFWYNLCTQNFFELIPTFTMAHQTATRFMIHILLGKNFVF